MKYNVALLHLIIYMGLLSCKSGGDIHVHDNLMEYAHVISISENDGIAVSVRNPWKEGAFLQNFILSEKAGRDYVYMPGSSSEIRTPFRKVVVMTNSVARLIDELGMVGSIAGVCDAQYIRDPEVVSRIQDGRIIDCGDGMNPDVEKIMDLQPDAIFVSPFENAGYGQLEKLGVPLIECAEYMETSPLGRAEWMRFYGRLLGVRERADSLFRYGSADCSYGTVLPVPSERFLLPSFRDCQVFCREFPLSERYGVPDVLLHLFFLLHLFLLPGGCVLPRLWHLSVPLS